MADLISREATAERMVDMAGCGICQHYGHVKCRACSWDDAMNIVDEMPAVDAIPVEWLRNICTIAKMEPDDEIFIGWLIQTWHDEQREVTKWE